jgi:hypothetical protein
MEVHAIQCKKCKDVIFSRANHDMRYCSCGAVAIDGGFDYVKISGNPDDVANKTVTVDVSKQMLYDDWNSGRDMYGRISGKS